MKFDRIEAVGRPQIERKAHKNAGQLRLLLGLFFVCIVNCNEHNVIGKNVIFKTFMNI